VKHPIKAVVNVFRENALKRHGGGQILGILRLRDAVLRSVATLRGCDFFEFTSFCDMQVFYFQACFLQKNKKVTTSQDDTA
jgi:hypothetical protein